MRVFFSSLLLLVSLCNYAQQATNLQIHQSKEELKAKCQYLSKLNQAQNFSRSLNTWTEVGPYQWPDCKSGCFAQGLGRLDYILLDTVYQRMFVCSPAGGVFLSYDKGKAWKNAGTDVLPVPGASAIQTSNIDRNIWFVASGEADGSTYGFSMGVYRTMDGGRTWQAINQIDDGSLLQTNLEYSWNALRIRELFLHPKNNDILISATNQGLYFTDQALSNKPIWKKVADGAFYDICYIQKENQEIIIASGDKVYHSFNQGYSFAGMGNYEELQLKPAALSRNIVRYSKVEDAIYMVHIAKDNKNRKAPIFKYNTIAQAWEPYTVYHDPRYSASGDGNLNPTRGQSFAIHPKDPNIWLAGNVPLRLSLNKGKSWSYLNGLHVDMHYIQFSNDGKELWVANDGGLYLSLDNGKTWEVRSNGLGIATIYDFASSLANPNNISYGAQDTGSLLKKKNSNWTLHLGGDGQDCLFHPLDSNIIYLSEAPNGRKLFVSEDGGNKWENRLSFKNLGSQFYVSFAGTRAKPDWIYYSGDGLARSKDRGLSWEQLQKWEDGFVVMENWPSQFNPDIVYLRLFNPKGFKNRLIKATNLTKEREYWQFEELSLPEDKAFHIAINEFNPDQFYIAFEGFSSTQKKLMFFNSRDFENMSEGLDGLSISDIVITEEPKARLFLGTSAGVYQYDFKNSLSLPYGDMPKVRVNELALNPGNWTIYSATFGRGIWKSNLPPLQEYELADLPLNNPVNYAYGNLRVSNKQELNLNGKLFLAKGAALYVEPGAKLILSGNNAIQSHQEQPKVIVESQERARWISWLLKPKQGEIIYKRSYP